MQKDAVTDAVDEIVNDWRVMRPDLDPVGLPITGRVLRLANHLTSRRDRTLAEFGLTVGDFDVLASLRRRASTGVVNVRDLQRSVMLSSGGMTKRLDRLESVGLIVRLPDPADRRGVLIELTGTGVDLIDEALTAVTASEREFVTGALGSHTARRHVEDGLRRLLSAQESL